MGDRGRPRARTKRGGRALRFAVGGSLLMTPPLASGCPDESQHTLNEPATVEEELPEPTSNEPTAPPPEADEESDPEPIKNNEGMPTEPPGAGTDGGAGESETAPE